MAIREIRLFGDPVLNSPMPPVARFDSSLRTLVSDMLETMDAAGGVGLAANQVGVAARVFVFDCQGMRGHAVNPTWRPLGDDVQTGGEGCLSVPGIGGTVTRHNSVVMSATDTSGRPLTVRATGLLARCIQHETDHLDGVMFMRRMDPEARKEAMALIRASEWFKEN
ncbi:peptide deformylase [Corynebacterium liangguodongii]|uniref:Peptide deformylase n=1 Tax=Corynebacterium liangguodongii TaxID=2079535 RepID=A0A2S0WE74_9CORY|nr:peptide deformylase [Corynebacterium liangguodongii]AWB84069.1 peptide deformylase [Corynebacterium liangguodongii]PWC00080.1 peptide deformylase [Corynebacterium liangguodongii]